MNSQKGNVSIVVGRIWSCTKCTETFSTVRQLREHRRDAHRRIIDINQCSYSYHKDECIYHCNNCIVKTKSQLEMEEHIKIHDPYICFFCNEKFYSLCKFAVHNETHEPGCYRCPLCEFHAKTRYIIVRHVNGIHLNKFTYKCDVCGQGFESPSAFEDHQNSHTDAKAITCVVCQKVFKFRSYLLLHQKQLHTVYIDANIQNQCKVCKIILKSPIYLKRHMRIHEAKQHLCDICGKDFTTKALLQMHSLQHTGVKQYTCVYCNKPFTQKQCLIMHERIHTGERPFACEFCGKAFNQRTALKRHIRGHTGERPYVCHICKKGFISKDTLNLHFKTCNG